MRGKMFSRTLIGAALAVASLHGIAQPYPSRPVRMLIPFTPGGGADISGRLIGRALTERLGVQFVIDNRPGASTMIATDIVAKAPRDGYTLLMSTGTHTINPSIFIKRPFDEIKDFTPIVLVSNSPNMLAVFNGAPMKNLTDFVAYAKANPGKLTYGSGGHGTHQHMAVEMFNLIANIKITHVPYKGGVPAINEAIGGQIMMVTTSVPALAPFVKAGKLRAIAVTSAKRSSYVPDIPTIAEQGYPGFDVNYWLGLMGPAGLPPAVVAKINQDVNAALKAPEVREQFLQQGAEPAGGSAQQFVELVKREIGEWAEVVKKTGIKPQ